jgi:hypothetical protein
MFSIKDHTETDTYSYKVCEISFCEEEAIEIYEDETKIIDVCDLHDKILNVNKWTLW